MKYLFYDKNLSVKDFCETNDNFWLMIKRDVGRSIHLISAHLFATILISRSTLPPKSPEYFIIKDSTISLLAK